MPIFGWLVGIKASGLHGNLSRRQADRLPTGQVYHFAMLSTPFYSFLTLRDRALSPLPGIGSLRGECTPFLDNIHCNLPTVPSVPSQGNGGIHRSPWIST